MANHFRLFSRPLVMDEVEAALSITGALPEYSPGDAFEGSLQVNNAIGRFRVEIMPDSTLPDGAFVRADNIAQELVLKWGAYQIVNPVTSQPVLNGTFEDGDDGAWLNHHRGWKVVDGRGIGGSRAAEFGAVRGINNYVGVLTPVTDPSRVIKLEASINHGSASTGELVVGPFLLWYDANRNLVRWTDPGTYVRGGANGDWHDYSYAEGAAGDAAIKFVAPGLTANRTGSPHSCWVDNVRWNHAYRSGQDTMTDYWVHLKVTDSANRVAYWSGYLGFESFFYTSKPYAVVAKDEHLTTGFTAEGMTFKLLQLEEESEDSFNSAFTLEGFEFYQSQPNRKDNEEFLTQGFSVQAMVIRDTRVLTNASEAVDSSYTLQAMVYKPMPQAVTNDPMGSAFTLQGFTIT